MRYFIDFLISVSVAWVSIAVMAAIAWRVFMRGVGTISEKLREITEKLGELGYSLAKDREKITELEHDLRELRNVVEDLKKRSEL